MPLLLLISLLGAADTGSVCLLRARWEVPTGAMTPEQAAPSPVKKFTVRIDEREPLDVSGSACRADGLTLEGQHRVRVYADGRLVESFLFTFQGRGSRLTLRHDGFYGSRSLTDSRRECPAAP